MPEIRCNGRPIPATEGASVAAALLAAQVPFTPLCGMGVCMQCRVTIDGRPHQLACQTLCRPGMEVTLP